MQEELSLREEVRAAGARLQLLVQGADIAGAPTASTLDESPDPRPDPRPKPMPNPEPNPEPNLELNPEPRPKPQPSP